jgi:hypothetical protein
MRAFENGIQLPGFREGRVKGLLGSVSGSILKSLLGKRQAGVDLTNHDDNAYWTCVN